MNIELIKVVPVLSGELKQVYSDWEKIGDRLKELSIAEMKVFRFLCKGLSNKEIAITLCKSIFTINAQTQSVLKKLKTTRRKIYHYGLYNN